MLPGDLYHCNYSRALFNFNTNTYTHIKRNELVIYVRYEDHDDQFRPAGYLLLYKEKMYCVTSMVDFTLVRRMEWK
jgi:hypothetical protein